MDLSSVQRRCVAANIVKLQEGFENQSSSQVRSFVVTTDAKTLSFVADTTEEYHKWINHIRSILSQNNPQHHADNDD